MNFFEEPKNGGLVFMLVGLLSLIGAIVALANGVTSTDQLTDMAGYIVIAIGAVLASLVYLRFGKELRDGAHTEKMDILSYIVRTAGVAIIIASLFSIVGSALIEIGAIVSPIIMLIVGFIFIWVFKKMTDSKATTVDKVIWILLLVASILLLIGGLGSLFNIYTLLIGLCDIFIGIMILFYVLDNDVKKQMGM